MKLDAKNILSLDADDKGQGINESDIKLNTDHVKWYIDNNIDRDSGVFDQGLPDTIVIHYTGSRSLKGDIRALTRSKRQVSAHFVIDDDQDGTIYQLMPLNKIAWHAGVSKMKTAAGTRNSINRFSIGIEVVNPGYLSKGGDGNFVTALGESVLPAEAVLAKHKNERSERYWCKYKPGQIASVAHLCLELKEKFGIKYIVGHDDISPDRKVDPGPLYPLDKLREIVLQQGKKEIMDDSPDVGKAGFVTVSALNIRERGESGAPKVAMPLEKEQQVEILDEQNGWYKVKTEITGWVSAKYIET